MSEPEWCEQTISVPFPAQEPVWAQSGDLGFSNATPWISCVPPTVSTYGEEAGQSGSGAADSHEGSERPWAPASPDATTIVTPRAVAAKKPALVAST